MRIAPLLTLSAEDQLWLRKQTTSAVAGEEKVAFLDAAYQGLEKHPELTQRHANMQFDVAVKRGRIKALPEVRSRRRSSRWRKSKPRCGRVEHVFQIVKSHFRDRTARYRAQLQTLFAVTNLVIAKDALFTRARAA